MGSLHIGDLEQALKAVTDRWSKRGRRYEATTVLTVIFRQWLNGQTLQGALITADALQTQTVVCREIRPYSGAHLLNAKRNQLSLFRTIRFLFSHPPDY